VGLGGLPAGALTGPFALADHRSLPFASTVLPSSAYDLGQGGQSRPRDFDADFVGFSSHSISVCFRRDRRILNKVLTVRLETDSPKVGTIDIESFRGIAGFDVFGTASTDRRVILGRPGAGGGGFPFGRYWPRRIKRRRFRLRQQWISARSWPATERAPSTRVTLFRLKLAGISSTATLSPGF